MADFRQLALDFVLEEDEAKLTELAQRAAKELEAAPANSNPVARWVEAVQPWMPGSNETEDSQETPDWTSRAKALEFLSRTLDFVKPDLLKPSQVKLLIAFFGAMLDIDHKAGILASASALSRIIAMKAFQSQSGYDIISKLCGMKEDFQRQTAKTRLAVYELLRSLMVTPDVASNLQQRDGASSAFMTSLLELCRNERDPDCLIVWFDILRIFLQQYEPSQDVLEAVFGAFKAYYPITLPRLTQSGITPENLKSQLRKCFSSTYRLAPLALPFLIGKLDQGDGVTVNVKVDVLKTIKECLEEYTHPEQSIIPFVGRTWGSLKYEVRNGEIEDAIWATLEVLKTLATRLKDDDLRNYTLDVTRDCVNDLSNPMYTTQAGRLLVSVLSANPGAFVLMVAPTVTHLKDNLRHRKSVTHSQDLLKVLNVILETRLLLSQTRMTDEQKSDFVAVDGVFKNLYNDVYKGPVGLGSNVNANEDDFKIATEAVHGVGALISQGAVPLGPENDGGLLLPEATCSEICQALFAIPLSASDNHSSSSNLDDLLNETAKALHRAVQAYTPGFRPLLDQFVSVVRGSRDDQSDEAAEKIQTISCLLAYVGCSELPKSLINGRHNFLALIHVLTTELTAAMDAKASPRIWCALVVGIQAASRYFNDACLKHNPETNQAFDGTMWLYRATYKYPELRALAGEAEDGSAPSYSSAPSPKEATATELRNDFLLIGLVVVRSLYRRATAAVGPIPGTQTPALQLSSDFGGSDKPSEYQYLHLISDFAGFVLREMSDGQQVSLKLDHYFLNLFQDEIIPIPASISEEERKVRLEKYTDEQGSSWGWLTEKSVNTLSLGLLEAMRPSVVAKLFDSGVAQELLVSGTLSASLNQSSLTRPVTRSILTILANKYKIEGISYLVTRLEGRLDTALQNAQNSSDSNEASRYLEQASSIYAIVSGLIRRPGGTQARGLIQRLRDAPRNETTGHLLARRLEMLVAPQKSLTKESFAIVKPLWTQKIYFELVKPMLATATTQDAQAGSQLVKTNYRVAVLAMVKHMPFSIWEDDSAEILRAAISLSQNLGPGPDTLPALEILKRVLAEAPDKAQEYVKSLIGISLPCFSEKAAAQLTRPEWLPTDYVPAKKTHPDVGAECGRLALEVVGALPRLFEARYVVPFVPQVRRELSLACGHAVRDLRRLARMARAAWTEIK
ncbi:Dos2-interacting transcription regulator of RNA-Pol-II domain-containing protein [Trichoderma novae-zelandiae]